MGNGEKVEMRSIVNKYYPHIIEMDMEEYHDFMDSLPDEQIHLINKEHTFANGFGKYKFYSAEFSRSNENIEGSKNLLEWDKKEWEFQQSARATDFDDYKYRSYDTNRSLCGDWIRLIIDDKLIYGFLSSIGSYLWNKMDNLLYDLVQEEIPHEVNFKFNPIPEKEGFGKMDIETDAKGRERELKELEFHVFHEYQDEKIYDRIDEVCKDIKGIFKVEDFTNQYDLQINYVFCTKEDLEKVTFEDFVDDIDKYLIDNSILDGLVKKALEFVKIDFEEIVGRMGIRGENKG